MSILLIESSLVGPRPYNETRENRVFLSVLSRTISFYCRSASNDGTYEPSVTAPHRELLITVSASSNILISIAPSSSLFGQPLSSTSQLLLSSPQPSLVPSSSSLYYSPAHSSSVLPKQISSALASSSSLLPSPTPIPGTDSTTSLPDGTGSSEGTESPTNAFNPTSPPGESQESIASISIFLILMLLGE